MKTFNEKTWIVTLKDGSELTVKADRMMYFDDYRGISFSNEIPGGFSTVQDTVACFASGEWKYFVPKEG
jgi:hypothetical protein